MISYDRGFSLFCFQSTPKPHPATFTTLKRTPGMSPTACPRRPNPAISTSSFSSMKFKQPSRGTNAAHFLRYLINCTRQHFGIAELGCFASMPFKTNCSLHRCRIDLVLGCNLLEQLCLQDCPCSRGRRSLHRSPSHPAASNAPCIHPHGQQRNLLEDFLSNFDMMCIFCRGDCTRNRVEDSTSFGSHPALGLKHHRLEANTCCLALGRCIQIKALFVGVGFSGRARLSKCFVPVTRPQGIDDGKVQGDPGGPTSATAIWKPLLGLFWAILGSTWLSWGAILVDLKGVPRVLGGPDRFLRDVPPVL
jgi:hypothetical protein